LSWSGAKLKLKYATAGPASALRRRVFEHGSGICIFLALLFLKKGKFPKNFMMSSSLKLVDYTPQDQDHDSALCQNALHELRELGKHYRDLAKQARHPACQMTFQMVHLFFEGATSAVHRYLRFGLAQGPRRSSSELPREQKKEDHTFWRPGAEPQIPLD
jgi:hypothetical protein